MNKCKQCNDIILEPDQDAMAAMSTRLCDKHKTGPRIKGAELDALIGKLDDYCRVKKEGDHWLVKRKDKIVARCKSISDAICTKNYYNSVEFGVKA